MNAKKTRAISPVTIERRTWMEWVGRVGVISLSQYLLGCGGDETTDGPPAVGGDAGPQEAGVPVPEAGHDATDEAAQDAVAEAAPDGPPGPCETSFPFKPGQGDHGVFDGWGERTVDPQDLASILDSWVLSVDGLVVQPMTFTFAQLLCLPRQDQVTDFHCVEGWSILDVPWNGVRLAEILERVIPTASATHMVFRSVGGKYDESVPLAVAREPKSILAYGIAGSSLPLPNGFPARAIFPRLLGYKSPKYVTRIEITDHPVIGFWSNYGYPYEGEVPPDRLRDGKY
jgi:hypothetical protein